jgi:23S rRNA pseudouridine955/2504/2580 synthase
MNSTNEGGKRARQTGVRKVLIDEDLAGQRIDNFLRRELPGLPKSRLYRILRRGEVRINGGRVRAEYRLAAGDEVRIPPVRINPEPPAAPTGRVRDIEECILFEDQRVIVINKPSGLAAHGGSGISHGAIELLRAARPDVRDMSLVHRLDRETSGCLVLAKKRSALRALHELFREGTVEKNYFALVIGDWQLGEKLIDAPLLVEHRKKGERHVVVSGAGKSAQTLIRLSRTFGKYSLVQCQPRTGRTHQIRVHCLHAGHAIAGDERYGDPEANAMLKKLGLKRLFLHAQSIAFPDDSGNEMHFTAPLTDDLQIFLERLQQRLREHR